MKIGALVVLATVAASLIYWLLRWSARRKRKNLLIGRWVKVWPELMYEFRFVPPSSSKPADTSQLSARDVASLAISYMSGRGVDPDALEPAARKKAFDEAVRMYTAALTLRQTPESFGNYYRLVERALKLLKDAGSSYTRYQRIAAELIMSTAMGELMKVGEAQAEEYFEGICAKLAMSEGVASAYQTTPAQEPGEDFKNAIAERLGARLVAQESGVDPASAYRVLPVAQAGKVHAAVADVDAVVEEHLHYDKSSADTPQRKQTYRRKLYPLAGAAIARLDFSFAEAVRLCSALGVETTELGLAELEALFETARAAEKAGAPQADAWADFRKARETATARFANWKSFWKIIQGRYEEFLAKHFKVVEIDEEPQGGLFHLSCEYESSDEWHPVRARQVTPDAALVYESAERHAKATRPAVHLLLLNEPKPAVTWQAGANEPVDLDAALAVVRMTGVEKQLHISLDGSRAPDGMPGGARSAIIRRDRISGEIKGTEVKGGLAAAAG